MNSKQKIKRNWKRGNLNWNLLLKIVTENKNLLQVKIHQITKYESWKVSSEWMENNQFLLCQRHRFLNSKAIIKEFIIRKYDFCRMFLEYYLFIYIVFLWSISKYICTWIPAYYCNLEISVAQRLRINRIQKF